MSGYLERLAARAGGAPAAAAPRPRSFFEDAGSEVEAVAQLPAPDQLPELRREVAAPPGPPEPPSATVTVRDAGATAAPVVSERGLSVPPAVPEPAHPSPPPLEQASTVSAPRVAGPETDAPRRPAAVAEPVAVRPARIDVPAAAPPAGTPAPTALEAAGPDTIHVTIGRVDVRASVAPGAPAPAPRTPAPESPVLSLHDYLRGERAR